MEEKELINQLIFGNKLAERKYCKLYRKRLERFVGRKVGDLSDVEEIVQDTLMSGLDGIRSWKLKEKF